MTGVLDEFDVYKSRGALVVVTGFIEAKPVLWEAARYILAARQTTKLQWGYSPTLESNLKSLGTLHLVSAVSRPDLDRFDERLDDGT